MGFGVRTLVGIGCGLILLALTSLGARVGFVTNSSTCRARPKSQAREAGNASACTINVRSFGARGDGRTDDRQAIQAAIDALVSRNGGVLRLPKGTYLLNSYRPAVHPWGFHNLLVGSGVHIEGERGATLLQGESGRAPLPEGATTVMNAVLAVGTSNYSVVTCQNPEYNGGFCTLLPVTAGSRVVTLARSNDANRFVAGDYVAIYAETIGDVIPGELTRVTATKPDGSMVLGPALARSFPSPVVANVTRLITTDVSLKNITVQGAVPLLVMETYGFSAEDCRFLADTNVAGSNAVTTFCMNTMRSFRFVRNLIGSIGPGRVAVELPQRNSQNGLFEANTFRAASVGFGEYGAHWRFRGNRFELRPTPDTPVAINISGLDVLFSGNDVRCEELSGGEGWGAVVTDFHAPGSYAPYVGRIRITGNTFDCRLAGAYCLRLQSPDPHVSRNRLVVRGSGAAIRVDGGDVASSIVDNTISVDIGSGVVLAASGEDGSVVTRNRIVATRGSVGIDLASAPRVDKRRVERNTIAGFRQAIRRHD